MKPERVGEFLRERYRRALGKGDTKTAGRYLAVLRGSLHVLDSPWIATILARSRIPEAARRALRDAYPDPELDSDGAKAILAGAARIEEGLAALGPGADIERVRRAVLGLGLENINRIVNRFRPFYFPETGLALPKPRFVLEGGGLRLIANPVRSAAELDRLWEQQWKLQEELRRMESKAPLLVPKPVEPMPMPMPDKPVEAVPVEKQ